MSNVTPFQIFEIQISWSRTCVELLILLVLIHCSIQIKEVVLPMIKHTVIVLSVLHCFYDYQFTSVYQIYKNNKSYEHASLCGNSSYLTLYWRFEEKSVPGGFKRKLPPRLKSVTIWHVQFVISNSPITSSSYECKSTSSSVVELSSQSLCTTKITTTNVWWV